MTLGYMSGTRDETPRINRRTVLKSTSIGAVGAAGVITFSGTALANCPCDNCVQVGKIEDTDFIAGQTFEFEFEGDDLVVEVTNVTREDGEPVCIDIKTRPDLQDTNVGHALCRVEVKGGRETETYDCESTNVVDCGDLGGDSDDTAEFCYDNGSCISKADDLCAPKNMKNPNRDRFGISNVVIYACDFNGDDPGLGGKCNP